MKRLLKQLLFDALLWSALYSVYSQNQYAQYADNFIVFFTILVLITGVAMFAMREHDDVRPELIKEAKDESKLQEKYSRYSTVAESFGVAIIGHPVLGLLYIIGGECIAATRQYARKEI